MEENTVLKIWDEVYPDRQCFGVRFLGTEFVKTRDGEMLASDVYLPSEGQRFPTVLIRTLMVNQEVGRILPLCPERLCSGDSGCKRTGGQYREMDAPDIMKLKMEMMP